MTQTLFLTKSINSGDVKDQRSRLGHRLFPIDEVLDDIFDTDIGASDEAKEANKEEGGIFCSPESER